MEGTFFLVDGTALAYRSHFAFLNNPLTNSRGQPTSATFGYVRDLLQLIEKERPTYLAVAFDVSRETFRKESFSWRHADYPNQEAPMLDLLDRLPLIAARSLVIVGTHDMMPVSKGEEMRDGIRDAQLVVLQNSGHFAFLEEPELFRETIWSFLGV